MTLDAVNRSTGPGSPWDDEFARYFGARVRSLRASAYALCGDWHHAEDITQTALLTLYRVWPRLNHETLDAYAHKVVLRVYLNERRRAFRGREELTVSNMAPRQQEVLVLRYIRDLSVEETAEELGLSTGTVKSQSARGLATLRKRLGPHYRVIVAAAATVAVLVAVVIGIALATRPPGPVEPAVPPSTQTIPTTPPSPNSGESVTTPPESSGESPSTTR